MNAGGRATDRVPEERTRGLMRSWLRDHVVEIVAITLLAVWCVAVTIH
jgi:hypothetical protein